MQHMDTPNTKQTIKNLSWVVKAKYFIKKPTQEIIDIIKDHTMLVHSESQDYFI